MKRRLVVITEIIAPYRIPVFNALAARPDIELLILFLSETDPSLRQWHVYKQEIQFAYELLPSFRRRLGKYNLLLNQGVAAALSRSRPDVILCGGYSYVASWQAAYWARREQVPFLLWAESTSADLRRRHVAVEALKRRYLHLCAGFVVPGRSSRDYLHRFGIGDRYIYTAPNAIDNDYFHCSAEAARRESPALRGQLDLPNRYFLNVGRLVEAKGVFDLLDAYAKLDEATRSAVSLVYVGDGAAQRELAKRAERLHRGLVRFFGFVQKDQLPQYYALADALVFPTHSDTWGFVVNEAMACGLPVIASHAAGCVADLVEGQGTGVVVRPRDSKALAAAMESLANDAAWRGRLAQRAIRHIQDYSPEACAAGIAKAAQSAGEVR